MTQQTAIATLDDNLISGMWKFQDTVSLDVLKQVAQDLLVVEPDAYRSMQVRRSSKTQYGIWFIYDCGESSHNASVYRKFFNRMTDQLKRRFGNDFAGWDITNELWTLK